MSTRPPAHKALIDALVDGEVGAREVANRAAELGATHGARITKAVKQILQARADGRITSENAKRLFRTVWTALSLGVFATVAEDVVAAEKDYTRAVDEANKLGPEKLKVTPVRDADRMAREQEKRNG